MNEREAIIAKINCLNQTAESEAIVTNNSKVSKLDEVKEGNRCISDAIANNNVPNDDEVLPREFCLINDKKCFSNSTENIAKNLIHALQLKDRNKERSNKVSNQ